MAWKKESDARLYPPDYVSEAIEAMIRKDALRGRS